MTDLAGALGLEGSARRAALNLTNVGDPQKDTVEFRHCNGTLDGRVIQAFTRLCAALIGAARWAPEAALLPPAPLGERWTARQALSSEDEPRGGGHGPAAPVGLPGRRSAPRACPWKRPGRCCWLYRRGAWQPGLAALASV